MTKRSAAQASMRVPETMRTDVQQLADAEGLSVEEVVRQALSEKISAHRARLAFARRAKRGDPEAALAALERLSGDEPPIATDEF